MHWQTSRYRLDLSRPQVMAIVNVTPDSFSDGGLYHQPGSAIERCEQALKEGADLLDIGAESTRPGARVVPAQEELERLLPVLRAALTLGCPVSVDTYKPLVMRAALDLGADIINDVWALRQPGAVEAVAGHPQCGVCLMHMHGEPQTMQSSPMDGDVLAQVGAFLHERVSLLESLGVSRDRMALDPGIGFGKTVQQNFALLAHQAELAQPGCALLVGWSRKSSLAAVAQVPVAQGASINTADRLVPSVVAAVMAAQRGAQVLRVHDVRATVQGLRVVAAIRSNE